MLFKLLDELQLDGPVIRYVGFRAGSSQNDVQAMAKAFGLPPAPEDYETANNLDSAARLNHIGIRVCWGIRTAPAPNGTRLPFWPRSRNCGAASPARTGSTVRCNGGQADSACRQGEALKGSGNYISDRSESRDEKHFP